MNGFKPKLLGRREIDGVSDVGKTIEEFQRDHPGREILTVTIINEDGHTRTWLSKAVATPKDYEFVAGTLRAIADETIPYMQMPPVMGRA